VQEQHPHVLEYFEARFKVVSIAESLEVEPDPEPPDPEPPRPRKTPNEKRDHDLNWFRVTTTDYRQKAILRLAVEQEFLDELRKQFPNLNEQELRRELQRFRDEALDTPGTGTAGVRPIKSY